MAPRKTMRERNLLQVRPEIAARTKALCAEYPDGGDWQAYANDMMDTFLRNYRSGKRWEPTEDQLAERHGEREWEGACL